MGSRTPERGALLANGTIPPSADDERAWPAAPWRAGRAVAAFCRKPERAALLWSGDESTDSGFPSPNGADGDSVAGGRWAARAFGRPAGRSSEAMVSRTTERGASFAAGFTPRRGERFSLSAVSRSWWRRSNLATNNRQRVSLSERSAQRIDSAGHDPAGAQRGADGTAARFSPGNGADSVGIAGGSCGAVDAPRRTFDRSGDCPNAGAWRVAREGNDSTVSRRRASLDRRTVAGRASGAP